MKSLVWILVPFAAYVGLVALLGDWIIDDAGISFAYARNLAEGHGLVSQPGRVPVEGFSNFLWVLACVPFLWTGAFDPIWPTGGMSAKIVRLLRRVAGVRHILTTESRLPSRHCRVDSLG